MKSPFSIRRWLVPVIALLLIAGAIWKATSDSPRDAARPTVAPAPATAEANPAPAAAPTTPVASAPAAAPAAPAASAGVAAGAAIQLWAPAQDTQGTKLPAGFIPTLSGHDVKGRTAHLDPNSMAALIALTPGESVVIPLLGGEAVTGRVNLVQADAGNWTRIGGVLTGDRAGTFALSANDRELSGTILLTEENLAIELTREADGRIVLQEKPLGDVVCTPMPLVPATASQAEAATEGVEPPAAAVPVLSSRPSATAVLYMDFDGETVTDPRWNGGATIVAAPANLTTDEISQVWAIVKEDYWAFNIDVTTDVNRYNNAPVGLRMRCIVTPTSTAAPGSGGVAYIDCFRRAGTVFSATIPCWVFNGGVRPAADSISHEFGHTFGLHHDGRTSPLEEYYFGHGSGAVGWAPIMGASFNRQLSQWSKGEYPNASQTEDDVAIISSAANGFGYFPDDAGGSRGTAAPLGISGVNISQTGIIGPASDSDYYSFTLNFGSTLNLFANPAPVSPNVDMLVDIEDAGGAVLATTNPDLALNGSISTVLAAGTYYVRVRGTGRGNLAVDGYSNYGSIGGYTLTGTVQGSAQPPTISSIGNQSGPTGATVGPVSFTVGDPDTNVNTLALSATSSNPTLVPVANITFGGSGAARTITLTPAAGQNGASTITVTVSDGVLTAFTSFTVTVTAPTSLPVFTTQPVSQTVTVGGSVTFTSAATGTPTPTYQWQKNGAPIGGATNASFTIGVVSLADAGSYAVVASNLAGSTPSNTATLTVNAVPPTSSLLSGTPIGSAPWHGLAAGDKFAAFDGNPATAFDSEAAFIYVGLDFGVGKTIDRIRYLPRAGLAFRMNGGRIRAANAADLSDAVTIYTVTFDPPEGVWQDVTLATPAVGYRYIFFTTDAGSYGNVAELEFYGTGGVTPPNVAPSFTTQPVSKTVTVGGSVTFTAAATGTPAPTYQWQKNGAPIGGATNASFTIGVVSLADAGSYNVVASNLVSSTPSNVATLTVNPAPPGSPLLSGAPIGSAPWHGLAAGDRFAAFDGNPATAFDSEAAFIYVGLDFGVAKTIDRIRYLPRAGLAFRMNGGRIRAANAADLSDAVTIHTITINPPEGVWQDVTLATPAVGYRYIFFTTDAGSYGNVAELEFYGPAAAATNTVTAASLPLAASPIPDTVDTSHIPAFIARGFVSQRDGLSVKFTITGDRSETVFIRAMSSTLEPAKLELERGTAVVASNADWTTAADAADLARAATVSGAPPLLAASGDSAILRTLAPGNYTVKLGSEADGLAMLEIHQLSSGNGVSCLDQVTVRGFVGAGEILTAGMVVADGASKPVVIRALGDGHPVLSVYEGAHLVAKTDGDEATLSLMLAPGTYAVEASGGESAGGVCEIELAQAP